jgi:hypothetical protein
MRRLQTEARGRGRQVIAGAAVFAAAAMYGCLGENIIHFQDPAGAVASAKASSSAEALKLPAKDGVDKIAEQTETLPGGYKPKADPFELDDKLRALSEKASKLNSPKEMVSSLFESMRVGGELGVTYDSSTEMRPPRTPAEVLKKGGKCNELAILWIGVVRTIQKENDDFVIPGGAKVVHFRDSGKDQDHMFAYATLNGAKITIDLQARKPGQTKNSSYDVIMDLDYYQSAAVPHQEWADFFRYNKNWDGAITAFTKSLEIYPTNPYAMHHLAALVYNAEFEKGTAAFEAKDFKECKDRFERAARAGRKSLDAGKKDSDVSAGDITLAERNEKACERNAMLTYVQ